MRHDVEAGAVAHRRGVQDRVAGRHRIDLGGIGVARRRQHRRCVSIAPFGRPVVPEV